ncbi:MULTISPECIES: hypothetical protein [Photobacterium]|uniref:hypothetical protein n=1 Tax=Photobacterium TaxID=657 RepID=UPI000AF67198|nr:MULTISPECIES: hypothetical protein [Photobacterium]MBV1842682.1 hypothetical protein [Photobacterium ganghwense]QSV14732.1 hypothetical protein FH974_03725 [Photobacterium ganghwense]
MGIIVFVKDYRQTIAVKREEYQFLNVDFAVFLLELDEFVVKENTGFVVLCHID